MTVLHQALKKSIEMKATYPVEILLEIGFPMYEANGDGQSVLVEILVKYIKDQIAEEIFKLFITKYGFDVLR